MFSTRLQTNTTLAEILGEAHFLKNLSVPLVVLDFVWMLPALRWQSQCWKFYTITSFYSMQCFALCKYTA